MSEDGGGGREYGWVEGGGSGGGGRGYGWGRGAAELISSHHSISLLSYYLV
jgi:hypothetical protein